MLPHLPFVAEVVAASGLLALAAALFFWQILLTNRHWMPAGGGDLAPFLYPNYHFAAQYLRQGIIPLWNPHLYSGAPFAADIQSGLFYPINLLLFLLAPQLTYESLEYLAIFHFWLAGTTMYIYLRLLSIENIKASAGHNTGGVEASAGQPSPGVEALAGQNTPGVEALAGQPSPGVEALAGQNTPGVEALAGNSPPKGSVPCSQQSQTINPLAAFAGALAFQFSDLFIIHFGNLNLIAVAAWLPLVFLLFQRSLSQSRPGLAAASGVILAIATLAGHIQITLFILLTLGLYTLWHLRFTIYDLRFTIYDLPFTHHVLRITHYVLRLTSYPLLALLITLLTTIGLSALLLLPAYEMSQYTPRAELPYEEAARYSLHPVQMVGLLIPNYFGRDPALHWGPWERVETGYIGLMPLMLALIGAVLYPGRIKGYFIGLGIIALLLALGGYSLVHGWLYAAVPGFDQLRAPARFILLLDFSLAALAAFGLNQLLQPLTGPAKAALSKLLKMLTWSLGGLIIMAAPLGYYAMLVTQDRNPAIFNRAVGAAAGVAIFALFTIAGLVVLHLIHNQSLRGRWAGIAASLVIGLDLFTLGHNVDVGMVSPISGFEHPEAIGFLQADPNHYRIEVTTDVWHAWQPNTALLHKQYDVWGLYNPLTLADTTLYWSGAPPRSSGRYNFLGIKYIIASKAGAPADGKIVSVFEGDPQINIYLNQAALARVLFVGHSLIVPDHDAAWTAIRADDFDPGKTVVLEGGPPVNTQPQAALSIPQYEINTVTVAVETDQPGYLVLSDAYYPGWQATVDGRPEPVLRANYAFRAVYVPAGQHTVQFMFAPVIWKVGLGISGLTLLILMGWLVVRVRSGRVKKGQAQKPVST